MDFYSYGELPICSIFWYSTEEEINLSEEHRELQNKFRSRVLWSVIKTEEELELESTLGNYLTSKYQHITSPNSENCWDYFLDLKGAKRLYWETKHESIETVFRENELLYAYAMLFAAGFLASIDSKNEVLQVAIDRARKESIVPAKIIDQLEGMKDQLKIHALKWDVLYYYEIYDNWLGERDELKRLYEVYITAGWDAEDIYLRTIKNNLASW